MNKQPDTALKMLQLLLRCGMVCREELNIVLETMADKSTRAGVPARRTEQKRQFVPLQHKTPTGAVQLPAAAAGMQHPQQAFVYGLD
jgi:hypothetical protein